MVKAIYRCSIRQTDPHHRKADQPERCILGQIFPVPFLNRQS